MNNSIHNLYISQYLHKMCILGLSIAVFLLSACGTKPPLRDDAPIAQRGMIEDLYDFPQDLTVYATGSAKNLMSLNAQKEQDTRFNRIYFSPWNKNQADFSLTAFSNTFGQAKGYNGTTAWTDSQWQLIKLNADIQHYPNTEKAGIITRQTSLRELPTMQPRYSRPTVNVGLAPFDYFQYSTLAPGMPVFVTQTTQDKQWYFIENSRAAGWVRSKDVAFVDSQFMVNYHKQNFAALTRDKIKLRNLQGQEFGHAYIGAIFPLISSSHQGLKIAIPMRNSKGYAEITHVILSHGDAAKKPLPLRAMQIANIGNEMMAQPYGWGGTNEYRDCSSTLHDLFTPFGIWLPRNSLAQYNAATPFPLNNLSPKNKESIILQKGIPFMSLIWMQGHIGLYLGEYEGRAAMFHNIWGIRVDGEMQSNNRHIIGRAVVTSLEPGDELPSAFKDQSILARIGGISTLP